MTRTLLTIFLLTTSFLYVHSQSSNNAISWEDFVNLISDESDDNNGPEQEMFEALHELHLHPINLNTATIEDLQQLPFLTLDDIKNILYYRDNHLPLVSTGELMYIYSLDYQKRLMTQLFCFAGEYSKTNISLKNILKYSQNELVIRTDIPLYTKEGYKDVSDSILSLNPNKKYKGNRFLHSMRYTLSSQNHFFAGFQLEKDPGEKYIDHLAGYAMIKDIGCINSAIIGNYKVSFGHGLVVNTGSSFGKTMKLGSMDRIDRGITKHSSTSETGYFSGAATTLSFGCIKTSTFLSYKKADGTFNNDSTGISSLKTDGLHRTELERSKKHNISITDIGANIHVDFNELQLSLTSAFTHINTPLIPKCDTKSTYYRLYNAQGKDFFAYSIAYSYRISHLLFSGETALNLSGSIATLNQLQWTPNSYNTVTLIQRRYSAKYNAINSRAFGENSSVQNETGVYLGWQTALSTNLKLSTYIDAMYFPWLKYQVFGSSYGFESLSQLTYTPNKAHTFTIRYRIKSKQKDYKADDSSDNNSFSNSEKQTTIQSNNLTSLKIKTNHSLRLQHAFNLSDNMSFRTTINGSTIGFANSKENGISIGETMRYTGLKDTRIDISANYYATSSYESRIYNFEPSLLYTFSMNSYYYEGIRLIILTSTKLFRNLSLTSKISSTIYLNKNTIGSSLEKINSNHKEDIQIQLRYKF